ncbi:hypothetical protein RclHR1_15130002 [Rhizophagus clarus]|uniref:Uncharacterized protein n=1 Tax=Rhizophagus clarus TaxID=94130 RepID=A0A2Z6QRW5_9GLOM|nr:hypothetical protein RclHR1_15130002 [Rhizophagus clarus]
MSVIPFCQSIKKPFLFIITALECPVNKFKQPKLNNKMLPDEKHDWTFGIKCCQMKVLPDKKHDWTFGIKVREVLPDEKHDQTFGIKCCQMKSTTGLLELSVARRKTRLDF